MSEAGHGRHAVRLADLLGERDQRRVVGLQHVDDEAANGCHTEAFARPPPKLSLNL